MSRPRQGDNTMWIFLPNSFISVVQKPGDTDTLTVRARISGDIESVFPQAQVEVDKGTDYKYRARVPREAVAKALYDQVMGLSWSNFKGTVKGGKRHDAYMGVWGVMNAAQDR